jgi:putative transposase
MEAVCGLFGNTRQAYYKAKAHRERTDEEQRRLYAIVLELVQALRMRLPHLGSYKLWLMLKLPLLATGIQIGRDRFLSILRAAGLLLYPRRAFHVKTTDSRHWLKRYPNLIRLLQPTRPGEVWVVDLTYIRVGQQFCYLSLVTDAYSHKIVGYAISDNLSPEGSLRAVCMALKQRTKLPDGTSAPLIHHSDRGIQYACHEYTNLLKANGIAISMTENGDPYENAVAERINGILKHEFALVETFRDQLEARRAIDEAVRRYNEERPHMSCDYLTPTEAHLRNGILRKRWTKRVYHQPVPTT